MVLLQTEPMIGVFFVEMLHLRHEQPTATTRAANVHDLGYDVGP